ncbi:EF-hand calcium-binding domain-containing protein 1 [Cryptotermes secundus]|uniref:EF-hand calcium-binding domain-containing protein 1 n=1 Tax=Cryptotermes secundus TaxID=105785 RepID=A0A2J7PVM5_9NEOP|nr:EF-hand calcium-binding domain-containing protein 1 [Cryptotermes secundus]PNF20379.1 EF-hand calcium-binding domain-containing protein 1 [Cryptotermes secundus]
METIPARRIGKGEALIKSVSLFVTSGRKASVAAAAAAAAWKSRTERQGDGVSVKEARSRKMGDEAKCLPRIVEALRRNTHFSRQETEALVRVYQKLVASSADMMAGQAAGSGQGALLTSGGAAPGVCEGLDRAVFRELLHNAFDLVTEDVLMDRIFCAFDRTCCGSVRLEDWMSGLSVFLRGTLEERTAFCFLVYDLNNDGFITRDEMFSLLKNCLMKQPGDEDPDEGVKDLVELVLRKLDTDRDGKISFQDFQTAVREEQLLLEAFGLCLPSEGACQTFMATLCS